MKNLVNRVQLIGNLGKDVQTSDLSNGVKKASVSIATTDVYNSKSGEQVKETQWHNLIAWGKTAERMSNMLGKGARIAVQGKLSNRSYEDKEGVTKYITEIIVSEFMLLKTNKEAS
ncbi:MAG: single-stranded DNA-binding protein [Saprospiraceae bacterium]|jgi:single-strand DNA-binding protein|nr:single-stranded DNA-binding protein [Saprospiraceae bacterium]